MYCMNCGHKLDYDDNFCEKCGVSVHTQEQSCNDSFRFAIFKKIEELNNQYRKEIDTHFFLTEQIGMLYSVAINLDNFDNEATSNCIELCQKDIALAPTMKQLWEDEAKLYNQMDQIIRELPRYPSFEYLAKIYEKQHNYNEAILLCKSAIDLGFIRDGTSGGIPGRLARLIKKQKKENSEIETC